jgi:hypothetical protein
LIFRNAAAWLLPCFLFLMQLAVPVLAEQAHIAGAKPTMRCASRLRVFSLLHHSCSRCQTRLAQAGKAGSPPAQASLGAARARWFAAADFSNKAGGQVISCPPPPHMKVQRWLLYRSLLI